MLSLADVEVDLNVEAVEIFALLPEHSQSLMTELVKQYLELQT